jgi:polysaccharide biosynthesis transport protein
MDARNYDIPFEAGYAYAPSARPAIGLADILGTLRRAWRLPVVGLLIGLAIALAYVGSVKTPYKSTARILIDRSVNRYLQTNKIMDQPIYDEAEIGSQVYVLSSDSVVVPVVRSMNLAGDGEFVGSRKAGAGNLLDHVGNLLVTLRSAFGSGASSAIDRNAALERIAVEGVHKNLTVTREDVANVINVAFESEDSVKAANIANALAETYVATSMEAKLKSSRDINQWLQRRLVELKTQVDDAERALQNYKVANNLANIGRSSQTSEQLTILNNQLSNARIATAEAKQRLDRLQHKSGQEITTIIETDSLNNAARAGRPTPLLFSLNSNDLIRLRSQYRDLETRQAEVLSRVGPGHAVAVKVGRQLDALRNSIHAEEARIGDAYVNEYQVAKAREDELAASVAQLAGDNETSGQLRELESAAETLRGLYNTTLQKFKETNAIQGETTSAQNARIITRATPPLSKNSKKTMAVFGGSVMLGLFLGLGAALGREWLADVFRTTRSVEQITDKSCVILPRVAARSALVEEFVIDAPYSRFTETLRDVKALIDTDHRAQDAKVIGIVSSLPNEGKTIVAANLAALMTSSSDARTLIIDSDLHLRKLTAGLAPGAREGLLEALENPHRLGAIVSRRHSGLDVLACPSSDRIPNAAELLGSPEMEKLLAVARKSYDYIIIEIAPIMSVVDVKTIERFIDRFVFVVEWGQTKKSLVVDALSSVEMIRDRIVGIVLNKADPVALRSIESYKGDRSEDYYRD